MSPQKRSAVGSGAAACALAAQQDEQRAPAARHHGRHRQCQGCKDTAVDQEGARQNGRAPCGVRARRCACRHQRKTRPHCGQRNQRDHREQRQELSCQQRAARQAGAVQHAQGSAFPFQADGVESQGDDQQRQQRLQHEGRSERPEAHRRRLVGRRTKARHVAPVRFEPERLAQVRAETGIEHGKRRVGAEGVEAEMRATMRVLVALRIPLLAHQFTDLRLLVRKPPLLLRRSEQQAGQQQRQRDGKHNKTPVANERAQFLSQHGGGHHATDSKGAARV
jgi:hypothetical protein